MIELAIHIPGYDLKVCYMPGEPEEKWGRYGATPATPDDFEVLECVDEEDGTRFPAFFARQIGERFRPEIWKKINEAIADLQVSAVA